MLFPSKSMHPFIRKKHRSCKTAMRSRHFRHFEYAMKTEGGYIRGGWSTPFCDFEYRSRRSSRTRLSSSRAPSLRSREDHIHFKQYSQARFRHYDFDIGEPHYIFRMSVRWNPFPVLRCSKIRMRAWINSIDVIRSTPT